MYKRIDLKDGEKVQYVGVYITRWQPEWGTPSVGFTEATYQLPDAVTELNDIKEIDQETYKKVLVILKKLDPYTTE